MSQYVGLYVITFIVYMSVYYLFEFVFPEFEFSETNFFKFFGFVLVLSILGGPFLLLGAPGFVITALIIGHAIYTKVKW